MSKKFLRVQGIEHRGYEQIMKATPVNATTDCKVEKHDLEQTVMRWERLLAESLCPHQHLANGVPHCSIQVAVYVLMDSNCHSGWDKCDKEEGDWLWIIACDKRKSGLPISISIKVRSLEPLLLELRIPNEKQLSATDEYEVPVPLWLLPYYGKSERAFCEKTCLEVIRHPIYEFRRAPLETDIRIKVDRAREERLDKQKATIMVAVLPLDDKERNEDSVSLEGKKKIGDFNAAQERIRNSRKAEGDAVMGNAERTSQRIKHLDGLLDIEYDKLEGYEKEYAMLGPGPARTALRLQMQRKSWPAIRKLETELAELLVQMSENIPEDEAKVLLKEVNGQVEKIQSCRKETWPILVLENLDEIRKKLKEPGKAATAKLRVTLPIIPLLASYIFELDMESTLVQTWMKLKSLFKRSMSRSR